MLDSRKGHIMYCINCHHMTSVQSNILWPQKERATIVRGVTTLGNTVFDICELWATIINLENRMVTSFILLSMIINVHFWMTYLIMLVISKALNWPFKYTLALRKPKVFRCFQFPNKRSTFSHYGSQTITRALFDNYLHWLRHH